jgi:hypothetical protein
VTSVDYRALERPNRRIRTLTPGPAAYTAQETVLLLVAALVFIDALIHVGAGFDHYGEFPLYTAVFCLLAAGQILWSVLLTRGPSARVLLLGCSFEFAIVALWGLSRTTGVPIASHPWVPEQIGGADLVETIGEVVAILAVLSVAFSARLPAARAVMRWMAPILLAVVMVSVLFGTAAHAG